MQTLQGRRIFAAAFLVAALVFFVVRSGAVQAVIDALTGHNLSVQGAPVPATHGKLSEHEREYIEGLAPQAQAENLMQAAVNHDQGATAVIMDKVDAWRGKIQRTKLLDALTGAALYSNDLRVRAAAIEVDLAAYGVEKTDEAAERLIQNGRHTPGNRPFDAWVLGMLASRGIQTDRIDSLLNDWMHDPDEQTRFWAVEGLAHIGTDSTIANFLDVLRNDPSQDVRERGGCSLAKSGMLTREQRMKAIPGLIEIGDDPAVNSITRNWAFQALREIADEPIGNDAAAWRNWFDSHGRERAEKFHNSGSQVLGNS